MDLLETGEELIALKESVQDMADPTSDGEFAEEADEYARSTGLTVDSKNWPTGLDHEIQIAAALAPTSPGELFELPGLPECAFRSIIPPQEELITHQNAVNWVHQLVKSLEEVDVSKLVTEITAPSNLKQLKFEEPFLRSDPDADRRALASKLAAFSQASLSNHRLPLHPVEPEEGEGLEFSTQVRRGDKSVMKEIDGELFRGGQEMQDYVYKAEKTPWSDDEQRGIVESVLTYEGLADQGYMTPPLSPRLESHTEPADYFVPDPDICLVPEPSPICSKLENEKFESDIEAAEKKIFKDDNEFWESIAPGEAYSLKSCGYDFEDLDISGMIKAGELPLSTSSQTPTSPPPKAEDLKLESPLLAYDAISDQETRDPQRIIKPEDLEQAKELIKSDDGSIVGDRGFSDFLQSKSEKMTRTAEQEKLGSVDGIGKVSVPVMDFSAPKVVWNDGDCDTPRKMFAWIKDHTKHVNWIPARWSSNRTAEQRMVWAPIPHIRDTRKLLVSEDIELDEKAIARFVRTVMDHEVVTSMDCVVKTTGFAILRNYDYDDELLDEETAFELKTGISETQTPTYGTGGLVAGMSFNTESLGERMRQGSKKTRDITSRKKRPRGISDDEGDWSQTLPGPQKFGRRGPEAVLSRDSQAANIAMMDSALTLRDSVDESHWDDHTKLVKQHTKIHNNKKPKVNSRFFGSSQQIVLDDDEATSSSQKKKQEEDARAMPPPPKPILALSPDIMLPSAPPKIMIATSVSGLLVIELRNLIPGLEIVLRDYDKRRPRGWYPGLRTPNLDEADITLSPAAGILLTTMVKLRQKSLPGMVAQGQGSKSGNFQHVVENVATRYERLIVFVSEGNKHSETITPLLGSDANALVEFQGFAAGLASSCDISVVYLGGGHETLAKWIAAAICQYADESAALVDEPLLEEETCWELFLRRAGMNPFGAQAVLGILRNTRDDDEPAVGGNGAMYGLPLFVMMTVEERIVMFEDVFWGRRVLNRVSEVLDKEWPQAPAVDEVRYPYPQGNLPVTYTGECWGQEGFQQQNQAG